MDLYEQKYKEAIEMARKAYYSPETPHVAKAWLLTMFPTIAESDDERIRKTLFDYFQAYKEQKECGITTFYGISTDNILAWLEKQGKQKTEPKFHPGDWITHNTANFVFKIINVSSNGYVVVNRENYKKIISFDNENNYHLWTIRDAKDGDLIYVSTEEKGIQAIFHEYKNDTIFFHCYLCTDFVQGGYMPIGSIELTYPLQKTHYSRFFEKMHKAGYEWDSVKKELRNKTLDADKVIEWLNDQACQGWIEDVEVDKFVDKFKEDFGL